MHTGYRRESWKLLSSPREAGAGRDGGRGASQVTFIPHHDLLQEGTFLGAALLRVVNSEDVTVPDGLSPSRLILP